MTYTEPIVPELDSNIQSLVRKYTAPTDPTFARELSRATPGARRAMRSVDVDRVAGGGRAASQPASSVALRAASTGQSVIGEPDTGLWGDISRNATEFISGLPRLPAALVGEVTDLPSLSTRIPEAIGQAQGNPVETLGNLANLPGLRMIPGSFVAGQFGTGGAGVEGLVNDPLFTAMDVLPFATKAAKATKTFRAASELAPVGQRVGPYGTLLKSAKRGGPVVTPEGTLALNPVGEALASAKTAFKRTGPGNTLASTFGSTSGDAMELVNRTNVAMSDPDYARTAGFDWAEEPLKIKAENAGLRAKHNVTEERVIEIRKAMDLGDQASIAALAPNEVAYMTDYKALESRLRPELLAEGGVKELTFTTPNGQTVTELLPARDANRVIKARNILANREHLATAAQRARAGTASLNESRAVLTNIMSSSLPTQARRRAYRGELAAMERAGYMTDTARTELNAVGNKSQMAAWEAKFTPASPNTFRNIPLDDFKALRAQLSPLARTDPTVAKLLDNIKAGQWARARQQASLLGRRTTHTLPVDWDETAAQLSRRQIIDRAAANLEAMPEVKTIATARKRVARIEANAMPARMSEVVNTKIAERLGQEVTALQQAGKITPTQAADAAEAITARSLEAAKAIVPDLGPAASKIAREVRQTWMQLVDDGYNPQFVHRSSGAKLARDMPAVQSRPTTVGSTKARVLDFAPSTTMPDVALDRQINELLTARGTRAMFEQIESTWGRARAEVVQNYIDFAHDAHRANPGKNFQAHLDTLIARDYRPSPLNQDVLIPRSLAYTLDRLTPKDFGVIARSFDRTMNVFRTALLPLSVRWQVYNATGNAIMTTASEGFGPWRHVRDAYMTAKTGILPDGRHVSELNIPAMSASDAARHFREQSQWTRGVDLSTKTGKTKALWDFNAGQFLRRIWDSQAAEKARAGGSAVIDRSYAANEIVDDTFRAMSFINAEKKALARGMSAADAKKLGEAAVRRVAVNWDRMTPIERSTVRFVFPFYSFAKKILEYTYAYPADHPLRLAVTASLVQAELDDWDSGLPQRYFSLLDVGGLIPDEIQKRLGADPSEGDSFYLSLDGMNPFRDVASYATLLGFFANPLDPGKAMDSADIGVFTSQMNPMAQLFLTAVGVDPSTGMSDPYQQIQYDPLTGGLKVVNDFNIFTSVPQAFIPQSKLLFDAAGMNRDFQRLLKTNPDAARRRLLSSAGLPVLSRTMNRDEEIVKAEMRRFEDVSRIRSQALRTGNPDLLGRYDSLKPLQSRISAMEKAGQLDKFRPDQAAIERALAEGERRSPMAG
jgi:hypothetical protein